MPKGINIKGHDISTAKKGQLVIRSPQLANALVQDAKKTLADLEPELGSVSLAHVEIDDAGRVVIKNATAAAAIRNKVNGFAAAAAESNGICGIRC